MVTEEERNAATEYYRGIQLELIHELTSQGESASSEFLIQFPDFIQTYTTHRVSHILTSRGKTDRDPMNEVIKFGAIASIDERAAQEFEDTFLTKDGMTSTLRSREWQSLLGSALQINAALEACPDGFEDLTDFVAELMINSLSRVNEGPASPLRTVAEHLQVFPETPIRIMENLASELTKVEVLEIILDPKKSVLLRAGINLRDHPERYSLESILIDSFVRPEIGLVESTDLNIEIAAEPISESHAWLIREVSNTIIKLTHSNLRATKQHNVDRELSMMRSALYLARTKPKAIEEIREYLYSHNLDVSEDTLFAMLTDHRSEALAQIDETDTRRPIIKELVNKYTASFENTFRAFLLTFSRHPRFLQLFESIGVNENQIGMYLTQPKISRVLRPLIFAGRFNTGAKLEEIVNLLPIVLTADLLPDTMDGVVYKLSPFDSGVSNLSPIQEQVAQIHSHQLLNNLKNLQEKPDDLTALNQLTSESESANLVMKFIGIYPDFLNYYKQQNGNKTDEAVIRTLMQPQLRILLRSTLLQTENIGREELFQIINTIIQEGVIISDSTNYLLGINFSLNPRFLLNSQNYRTQDLELFIAISNRKMRTLVGKYGNRVAN